MSLDQSQYERIEVYPDGPVENSSLVNFKAATGNTDYRVSTLTWVSLFTLIIGYPALTVGFTGDPTAILKNLNEGTRLLLLISTIVFQWVLFSLLLVTVYRERTMLGGLGLKKIRAIDFAWAVSFLLAANVILSGLAWFLGQIGLPMPGEIGLLVPEDALGRVVWVAVSFTAGFCEEIAFRGYLMTRLRILLKLNGWLIPVLVSSVAFGVCHAYQGWPGLIVITTYGAMFALLYIRTGSLWPCIIAHFFQDFGALFFPK